MENTGMSNTIMSLDETTPLGEWMAYWLENYVRPIAKPAGYQHYRDNVEKHILPHLGKIPLGELTPRVLQQFLNQQAIKLMTKLSQDKGARDLHHLDHKPNLPGK